MKVRAAASNRKAPLFKKEGSISYRYNIMDTQQAIVACARGWIGTRFHHQGRLKKTPVHHGGVDCLGLLVGVASELGLKSRTHKPIADFDHTTYPHYPQGTALMHNLNELLDPVSVSDMQAGDIALMAVDGAPRHLGIVSAIEIDGQQKPGLIHAYAQARKVVEHAIDAYWKNTIIRLYRVPGAG